MIRGVLFDFDGTLTLPGALNFPRIKQELGCPVAMPILEYLETLPLEKRRSLMKVLEKREEDAAAASRPNEGAERVLLELRKRDLLLGILTRNSMRSVKRALEAFKGILASDFAAIITRESSQPKPHPEGVYRAAEKMGLPVGKLLVVGDFRFDIQAGNAAGAPTVLLVNDGVSPMLPGDPKPDFTVRRLEDILGLLPQGGA